MTTVETFLDEEVRTILSDIDKDRWTDDRLIQLLNDGLLDLSINTEIFTRRRYIQLVNNIRQFDISSFAVKLIRIQYRDKILPFKTFEEMDSYKYRWETDTANDPSAVVFNKQNRCNFMLYPIVEVEIPGEEETTTFGSLTGTSDTDAVITQTTDFTDEVPTEDSKYLIVYYSRRQPKILNISNTLEVDDFALLPLAHFVSGMALRDNMDTQNREMAAEELGFYSAFLQSLSNEKAYSSTLTGCNSIYNPMV